MIKIWNKNNSIKFASNNIFEKLLNYEIYSKII